MEHNALPELVVQAELRPLEPPLGRVQSPMNSDLRVVLDALRRGEVIRVGSSTHDDEESSCTTGHVVLAAERALPESLARLVRFTDVLPVFATTRSRLEDLGVVGVPFIDDERASHPGLAALGGDSLPPGAHQSPPLADRLAAAAAALTSTDAEQAQRTLTQFPVICVEWGGVANCERVLEAAVDLTRLAGLAPAALVAAVRQSVPDESTRNELVATPTVSIRQLVEHRRSRMAATVVPTGPAIRLPTRHGSFKLRAYEDTLTGQLHLALWTGDLREPTLTRIHSECMTGDLLGSLRCDCGTQLNCALSRLRAEGGVLLYLRQEGRGIGLLNKLRAYDIQDRGFDTVEANAEIGFAADLRDYSLAAQMLADLGVFTIRLLTNNPQKVRGLKKHGIRIAERVPLIVEPCSENESYLEAKRTKLGHLLSPTP